MAQVLIVEDHADIRNGLVTLYERAGHTALSAKHGRDALDLLEQGHLPTLILLDLMMPVMDGLSFLEILRADPRWQHLRVVIHTAYDRGIQAERLRSLGVGEIMLKDAVDVSRLLALVTC